MMWVRLIGSALILGGGIVSAQSADESVAALESCFQASRVAHAICSKLPDDPALRLDCFQKERSAELECLDHVIFEMPAATPKTPSEATRSEPPASAAPATPNSPPEAPRPEPPASAALPEGSSERVSPPAQTTPAGVPSAEKSNSPPKAIVGTNPPGSAEAATGAIQPDISPKTADVPVRPTDTNWVISETTSPVDYSPLVTGLMHSTSKVKGAPSTLVVRCVGERTELLVRTDGTWNATRGHELRVDYQVNDQPAVGLQWISVLGWKDRDLQGRSSLLSPVSAGRCTSEDQRGRPSEFLPRSDVPDRRMGRRPQQNRHRV